ncbi:hypothetical protein AgCh_025507 [Apium graveolens]
MEEKAALKLTDETSNDDASSTPQTITGVEGKSEKRMLSLEDLYSDTTKKLTLSRNVLLGNLQWYYKGALAVVQCDFLKIQWLSEFVPRAHLLLFVISADRPLTDSENPIIDPEINGLGDIISAVDEADVEFDDTRKRIELQLDSVHHVLGEICSADSSSSSHNYEDTVDADVHISSDDQINMEQSSRVSKPEDGAEVMETSSMSDDKLLDNLKKDQVHQAMHVTIHKELEVLPHTIFVKGS